MSLKKIKQDRLKKLETIKTVGIDPYPAKSSRQRILISQVLDKFNEYEQSKKEITLVGRLRLVRLHGGLAFANLEDVSGQIQLFFKKDTLGEKEYAILTDNIDMGDFLEVSGEVFLTQKGERTLLVKKFQLLAKTLNQLPDKWHGLKDIEERFRRRYLDLLMNKDIKARFRARSEIIKNLKAFLESKGFMEVETPILQLIPGGALAKPFKTHLNALDMDLYLRIAPELHLKRLLVGGFEKVYELGRCFRNEGMDKSHNPDFTILEFYWAYADYEQLMELTEEMFEFLVPEMEIEYQEKKINLTPPFKRITLRDLILKEFKIDIDKAGEKEILAELKKQGIKPEDDKPCRAIDALFKEVRPKLLEPTFVVDHPLEMSPLAKEKTGTGLKKSYAERFQLIVGGLELINAYSELNDPQEQDKRLKEQVALHGEEVRYDQDFIESLEYGLPPAAGWGLGVDRLIMLLTNAPTVREVILFPAMKEK
jgi:lysyl-tRNA synthetase class 2